MRKLKDPFTNPFSDWVVKKALMVPKGRVTTYGRIARAAGGGAQAARSVTAILGKAYDRGERGIPFHRIVYADGSVWLDDRHRAERLKRYYEEGIDVDAQTGKIRNFKTILFEY